MKFSHVSKGIRRRAKQRRRRKKQEERERRKRDREVTSKHGMVAHNACGRKKRYDTEWDAVSHANMSRLFAGINLRPYKCPYCGGWHLTSKPRRNAK